MNFPPFGNPGAPPQQPGQPPFFMPTGPPTQPMYAPQSGFAPPAMRPQSVYGPYGSLPSFQPLQQTEIYRAPVHKMSIPTNFGQSASDPLKLYVGNITDRYSDVTISNLLSACGPVAAWRRVKGADGRLQGFGYCEFEQPEAALRAVLLLNNRHLFDKSLIVKADKKTGERLMAYQKLKLQNAGIPPIADPLSIEQPLDELSETENALVRAQIEGIIADADKEAQESGGPALPPVAELPKKSLHGLEIEDDRRHIITKEIGRFRGACLNDDPSKPNKRDKDNHDGSVEPTDSSARPDKSPAADERDADSSEKRRQERRQREREERFQERVKAWERRERDKQKAAAKQKEKDEDIKRRADSDAIRAREFMEDYDDARDDQKWYRGHAMQQRLKDRERELEADAKDRRREKEEMEEIRKKLQQVGCRNIEQEMEKLERESMNHLLPRLNQPTLPPPLPPKQEKVLQELAEANSADGTPNQQRAFLPVVVPSASEDASRKRKLEEVASEMLATAANSGTTVLARVSVKRRPDAGMPTTAAILDAGGEDDEGVKKKQQQRPFAMSEESKREQIKQLIDRIPTQKGDLFAYQMDWDAVDKTLMEKRVRPWIDKKIIEYIGEREPTLSEFLCQKVLARTSPTTILSEIQVIFDDDAEVFVVKLWRLLVYETEARKAGLTAL